MGAAVMVGEAAVTDLAGQVGVMASVEVFTGVSAATALVAGSAGRADFEIVVFSVLDIRIITHILIIWDTSDSVSCAGRTSTGLCHFTAVLNNRTFGTAVRRHPNRGRLFDPRAARRNLLTGHAVSRLRVRFPPVCWGRSSGGVYFLFILYAMRSAIIPSGIAPSEVPGIIPGDLEFNKVSRIKIRSQHDKD
jgi:hypothetical protein